MKMLKPYEKLAEFYSEDWGNFSLKYVDIIDRLAREVTIEPKSAIDIACGTGNLISALSSNYSVIGADISESMIKIAKANYPNLTFSVSDMAEIKIKRKFGLVLCPFDSINYIVSYNKMKKTMRNVFSLLSDDGYFLFDFNTEHLMKDKHHGTIERHINDVRFTQSCLYNPKSKMAGTIFDFGNSEREVHLQRPYSYSEMKTLLEESGLIIFHAFDLFDNSELKERSYKIMIQCRKKWPHNTYKASPRQEQKIPGPDKSRFQIRNELSRNYHAIGSRFQVEIRSAVCIKHI